MSFPPFLPASGSRRFSVALPANNCSVTFSEPDRAGVPPAVPVSLPSPQPATTMAATSAARNGRRGIRPKVWGYLVRGG